MSGFGLKELLARFPEAYRALPQIYKEDSVLVFFIDINQNLCAEHDLGEEFLWNGEIWIRIN